MSRRPLTGLAGMVMTVIVTACQPHQFTATVLRPPKPIADFSTAASDGSQFTLSQHQDRLVILFFGYTNCPDVCPLTLAQLKLVSEALRADASRVQVAFVTVDPKRDSLVKLKSYLDNFNPAFIGLRSDDPTALKALGQQFGIYYELGSTDPQADDYLVMHTSSLMVVSKMGLLAVFPPDTKAADIAADLKELLKTP